MPITLLCPKLKKLEGHIAFGLVTEMFKTFASTKIVLFIAVALFLLLLWQLKVSIGLQWEK